MFLNCRLYLSNCDSINQLDENELEKKILTGLCFSKKGVVVSPNILLDNKIDFLFKSKILSKYLNEEGYGSFIIRGKNFIQIGSFQDYFDNLPNSYKVSMFNGKEKGKLNKKEIEYLVTKLRNIDKFIKQNQINLENADLNENSLTFEIHKRLKKDNFFNNQYKLLSFCEKTKNLISRSDWYNFVNINFKDIIFRKQFIFKYIDPSYYYLYTSNNEGFIQENKAINSIKFNKQFLYLILLKKSLEDEKQLIETGFNIFCFIVSLGKINILKYLTDQAKDFIKDKTIEFLIEKDWLGIYNKIYKKLGIEIKNEKNNL